MLNVLASYKQEYEDYVHTCSVGLPMNKVLTATIISYSHQTISICIINEQGSNPTELYLTCMYNICSSIDIILAHHVVVSMAPILGSGSDTS